MVYRKQNIVDKLKDEWRERTIKYKFLALLAGIDTTIRIFTPIILVVLWVSVAGLDDWLTYLFYGLGLLATMFRAIKTGFLND